MNTSIGIYVHIPFCASHCVYCHFVIDLSRGEIQKQYVDALLQEIGHWGNLDRFSVDTVYIGGGTPSWIDAQAIPKIFSALRANFRIMPYAEITIEANPDSLEDRKLEIYCDAGINRISIGVQSFRNDELKRLGRTHTAWDADRAIYRARHAGFSNISIDLISGLPNQTVGGWNENLQNIQSLQPEHISLYLFDVDEESPLGRKILSPGKKSPRYDLPDEGEVKRLYEFAQKELDRHGYEQYEISNFARRSDARTLKSLHNLKYWNMQPYLGLGCAAHSFIGSKRWRNENSTEKYIQDIRSKHDAQCDIEELSPARQAEDAFIFGLRQIEGIHYDTLSGMIHQDAHRLFRDVIDPLVDEGWLIEDNDHLRLAPQSLLVSNEIFRRFLAG